jgi:hypothetical protein
MDLKAAQRELDGKVMGRKGVAGTAIGEKGGKPCLKVYLDRKGAGGSIPKKIGGVPVVTEVTGRFRRL